MKPWKQASATLCMYFVPQTLFIYILQQFSILLIATLLILFGMYLTFDGQLSIPQSQVQFDYKIITNTLCVNMCFDDYAG